MTDQNTTEETRVRGARQTGRLTFFELAENVGFDFATDTMMGVVRMSPLLEERDVADWRKAWLEQTGDNS